MIKGLIKFFLSIFLRLLLSFTRKKPYDHEIGKSILFIVVKPTGIGDLLMDTPSIRKIRNKYPDKKISLLTDRDMFGRTKLFDEVIIIKGFLNQLKYSLKNRRKYDLVILLNKNLLASILSFPLFNIYLLGYVHSWKVTSNIKDVKGEFKIYKTHLHHMGLEVIKNLGFKDQSWKMERLRHNKEELARVKDLIIYSPKEKLVVVNTPCIWPSRAWPKKSYIKLIKMLLKENYKVVVHGGPGDYKYNKDIDYVFEEEPLYIDVTGKVNMYESSALFKLCDLMITNDAGPMHIGISEETNLLSLWGPTDPWRRIPLNLINRKFHFICPEGICEDAYNFERPPRSYDRMKYITPKKVFDKAIHLLKKPKNI